MKKHISFLLAAAMLLSLCACGTTPAAPAQPAPPAVSTPAPAQPAAPAEPAQPASPALQAGFGRADITPELGARGTPLAGYTGARPGNAILDEADRLYATAVALQDASGETVILITLDVIGIIEAQAKAMRNRINDETGIPHENIQISCTHTHSGPHLKLLDSTYLSYNRAFMQGVVDCAAEAVADLAPATLSTGSTQVEDMNFVRHYNLSDGTVAGDNFGNWSHGHTILGHTTESDKQMQLIRFDRQEKKAIVMANWQAHPKLSSTSSTEYGKEHRPLISSDFVGYCRSYVEADADCLFAFYLGAAGNLNPLSNISSEKAICPEDTPTYSRQLADYVLDTLDSMTEQEPGIIQTSQHMLQAKGKASNNATIELELNAVSVGPIAFATVPYEMFDTNGMYVKENSPFQTTFMLSLANGSNSYVPSAEVFDYDPIAYENTVCEVAKGTGEDAAEKLVDMLSQQHENAK